MLIPGVIAREVQSSQDCEWSLGGCGQIAFLKPDITFGIPGLPDRF